MKDFNIDPINPNIVPIAMSRSGRFGGGFVERVETVLDVREINPPDVKFFVESLVRGHATHALRGKGMRALPSYVHHIFLENKKAFEEEHWESHPAVEQLWNLVEYEQRGNMARATLVERRQDFDLEQGWTPI